MLVRRQKDYIKEYFAKVYVSGAGFMLIAVIAKAICDFDHFGSRDVYFAAFILSLLITTGLSLIELKKSRKKFYKFVLLRCSKFGLTLVTFVVVPSFIICSFVAAIIVVFGSGIAVDSFLNSSNPRGILSLYMGLPLVVAMSCFSYFSIIARCRGTLCMHD